MFGKITTLLSIILAHTIHALAYLVPRSKSIWVVVGWHRNAEREIFADNSKYLFLHLQDERADITSVWLAQDRKLAEILTAEGYTSYYVHSLRGMYYALRAGYTIVDARITITNWKFSSGSHIVQLWHGKGMKKSGHDGHYNSDQSYFINPSFFLEYDDLIATSPRTAKLLAGTFSYPEEKILITGQPRTDVLFKSVPGSEVDSHDALRSCIEKAREVKSNKIILYAPTFRADGSSPLKQFDFATLNSFLAEHNFHFIIGLHPKFAVRDVESMDQYSHIFNIPPGFDSYPLFKDIDLVITDYSNIYIDFLLLDIPVIFYTYDEAEYRTLTGLHEDFDTLTPGPHVATQQELMSAIAAPDGHTADRERARTELFTQQDSRSSERVIAEIYERTS